MKTATGNLIFAPLTGVRWLAASMVFAYHNRKYWRGDVSEGVLRFLNEGHMGVTLFFVLSGFLIAWNYESGPLETRKSYLRYALTRLARILPLYWLILTVSYLDYGFPSLSESLRNYSLFHAFSDLHSLDGISQSWTLNLELCFYSIAPFVYLLMRKSAWKAWLFTALLFLPAFLIGYSWFRLNGNPQSFLWPVNFLLHGTFFGRFPEFLIGVMMAVYLRQTANTITHDKPVFTIIGSAGMIFTMWLLGIMQPDIFHHGADHPLGPLVRSILFPFFTVLFLSGLIRERSVIAGFFGSKPLVLLGNASFAFYLVHISYVNIKLKSAVLLPDRNYVLLWAVSILLYLLFEKPVYQFLRNSISKLR